MRESSRQKQAKSLQTLRPVGLKSAGSVLHGRAQGLDALNEGKDVRILSFRNRNAV